jgi:hypothetical protein
LGELNTIKAQLTLHVHTDFTLKHSNPSTCTGMLHITVVTAGVMGGSHRDVAEHVIIVRRYELSTVIIIIIIIIIVIII